MKNSHGFVALAVVGLTLSLGLASGFAAICCYEKRRKNCAPLHPEPSKQLLEFYKHEGFDVNLLFFDGTQTVLMKLANKGYNDLVAEVLTKYPHLINRQDNQGRTALMFACSKESSELLLEHGAILDSADNLGKTAYDYAHAQLSEARSIESRVRGRDGACTRAAHARIACLEKYARAAQQKIKDDLDSCIPPALADIVVGYTLYPAMMSDRKDRMKRAQSL